jgi:transposase
VHELREVVNAILYINRTGCAWEYLPHDLPPYKTVYGHFAAWRDDGTTERIHDLLRRRLRRSRGRSEEPSAVAVDSQTVKASGSAAPDTVGFDGNKKTRGRKRHIAVDTLGLLIVLGVSAASLADSPVGRQVLTHVAAVAPTVTNAWVDGGYNQKVVDHGAELGIEVEVVQREPGAGFKVLPRRWVGAHLRLVHAARAPGTRLRGETGKLTHDDPLVDNRAHEQSPDPHLHTHLARPHR